jgi:putative Mg2+ transporter-C (MgtC) family protein
MLPLQLLQILHQGPYVKGLTTAASLWTTAALGLAVGLGAYIETVSDVPL